MQFFIKNNILNKEGKFITDFEEFNNELEKRSDQVEAQVEAQVKEKIIILLKQKEHSVKEILKKIGQKSKSGGFKKAISELMDEKIIKLTEPDSPNSPKQKYKITRKGLNLINKNHSIKK